MGSRHWVMLAVLTGAFACGCGAGSGQHGDDLLGVEPGAPAVLPAFPGGSADLAAPDAPRLAAFTDTALLGKDTWLRSASGALNNGDSLDLTSTAGAIAWGMWRWPGFIAGIKPQQIELEVAPGNGSKFWLLLADYTSRHWEIHGPLDGSITTFTFDQSKNYISGVGKAVYAVLLVEGGATLEADRLTLSTTDLPAPENLSASDITGSAARLSWDPITSPTALGYQIYTGPAADFNIGDPGVERRGPAMITSPGYLVTSLAGSTHYFWRVRAYFGAWGPLSSTAEFTTLPAQLPVPVITVDTYLQKDVEAAFGSFDTTDGDTPLEELVFRWDFENDGTIDEETTGPALVYHTYTSRGPFTVKLTAYDGQSVSVTKNVFVGFRYRIEAVRPPQGMPATVTMVDADTESGRVVMLCGRTVRYFDGTGWESIDLAQLGEPDCPDVALNPSSFSVIAGSGGVPPSWRIYDYNGSGFDLNGSATGGGNMFAKLKLDIAPNGRRCIALLGGNQSGTTFTGALYAWHEKADGTYSTDNVTLDANKFQACDVVRSDTDSYFLYAKGSSTHLWSFNDSGNSDVSAQSYSGDATSVALALDPANPANVFWATANGSAIYYGDNYGEAGGAGQSYATALNSLAAIAVGLAGDNQGHFYYTGTDASDIQYLRGFDTAAGGGTLYNIISGVGAAAGGVGAYYPEASATGVYTAVIESRDGEVIGRKIDQGEVQSEYQACGPAGVDMITDTSSVVAFSDNSFLCLSQQAFPTALAGACSGPGGAVVPGLYGDNAWCIPNCAAADPLGGGCFVGSYTDSGRLLLNRYATGDTTGTVTANLVGTAQAQMVMNHDFSAMRLFYLANSSKRIEARSWDGASWSDPVTVYSGSSLIESYAGAVTADTNEWGVILIDAAEKLKLIETSSGTWGSALELSSQPVQGSSGIAFAYCADIPAQGFVTAVEREGATEGVFIGIKPRSGTISWQQLNDVPATDVIALRGYWHLENPIVIFQHVTWLHQDDRLWVNERLPSGWFLYQPYIELHSNPLASAVLPAGHMIFCGYEMTTLPRQMMVVEFYP